MRKQFPLLTTLVLLLSALGAAGQSTSAPTPAPPVRYHAGDSPDWAAASLDDSAWPIAPNGLVPSRARETDRFLWVRLRVPVPAGFNAPIALHIDGLGARPLVWQAFVNGHPVGGQGDFPPNAKPVVPPISPVIPLPATLIQPGATAIVTIREWHAPSLTESGVPTQPTATIAPAESLALAVRAHNAESLIANGPEYFLESLLALTGIALLAFWRTSGGREYLYAAIFLLSPIGSSILSTPAIATLFSFHTLIGIWAIYYAAGLIAEIELLCTLFGINSRPLRVLWHAIWVAIMVALIAQAYFLQSPTILRICQTVIEAGIPAFDCILFPVCIREIFRPNGNRTIAAAQSLFEICVLFGIFGYQIHFNLGKFPIDLWNGSLILIDGAIAAMLFRRAWKAYKDSSSLQAEFEAAREVQQQLVAPAVDLPGFQIQSAYIPAKQVGGDFFRVLPHPDGSVLVVTGDVSGKGLKAAMTVSAIMGALRGCQSRQPAEVLNYLNRVLFGQVSGFVTCSVAHISPGGDITLANAGNPSPYCNGLEIPADPGLPLGLISESSYTETLFHLDPAKQLTFVSDGVPEAQKPTAKSGPKSPSGDLFGFDRTAAISTQSAQSIAQAAQSWGQSDDITVLTLTRLGDRA